MQKRPLDVPLEEVNKRIKVDDKDVKARRARERIALLKAKKLAETQSFVADNGQEKEKQEVKEAKTIGRGLNVELHPLLTGEETKWKAENPNLHKFNKRGYQVNPYLSDTKPERRKREFRFNEHGKYIAEAEELRKQLAIADAERRIEQEKRVLGLVPDVSIQEDKYKFDEPPLCEWWDQPFVNDTTQLKEESVSNYIQHPVPIMAPWERHLPPPKPLFLTKKETKRIRRQTRAEKYEEQQNRIKLGLEPPPPPKVKLNNLMAALTNEAIKDPTAVEQRVRKEVEQRRIQHESDNLARKLTKEQKVEKVEEKVERDLQKGFYSAVFVVDKLDHPSHKFKVERNASQLRLTGTVLHSERFALVIVEGSEKNVRHYKKLMINRIKWDESTEVDSNFVDLKGNKCELLWEGQLKEFHFKRWSVFRSDSEQGALDYLAHFGVVNYYKEAVVRKS